MGCEYVSQYLGSFLDTAARQSFDLERVSQHIQGCRPCYDALGGYFRAIDLPESAYLRETIDEMCLAMYRLAQTVLKERHDPEDNTDNVVPVEGEVEGSARDHAQYGREMIEDAEDFVGSSEIQAGCDLEDVRRVLDDVPGSQDRKVDLAIGICTEITRFNTRHLATAYNMIGVLRLWRNQLDAAEADFMRVLSLPDGDDSARSARAFAHCNLGYVRQLKGDVEKAIQSAKRSVGLCEELGVDPFHGLFALMYFHLLQKTDTGHAKAKGVIARILGLDDGKRRLESTLALENNGPIRDAFRASGLSAECVDLSGCS